MLSSVDNRGRVMFFTGSDATVQRTKSLARDEGGQKLDLWTVRYKVTDFH